MAEKHSVQVLIGGRVTTVSGYESEEYIHKVSNYLSRKLQELGTLPNWRRMPSETKGTLTALNIADDCFKARERVEELEEELKARDHELYVLRQQIVDLEMRLNENQKG